MHRPTVTTPAASARAAARAVYQRKYDSGDRRLDLFPDLGDRFEGAALLAVVEYLLADQHRNTDDALDGLTILDHLLGRTAETYRLNLIRRARRSGATWQQVASALGLRSPQGAEALFVRLALTAADAMTVKTQHGQRDRLRTRQPRRFFSGPSRQADIVANRLWDLVNALLQHADALPTDVVDDLTYLVDERARHRTAMPETVRAQLRLSIAEIRQAGVFDRPRIVAEDISNELDRYAALT